MRVNETYFDIFDLSENLTAASFTYQLSIKVGHSANLHRGVYIRSSSCRDSQEIEDNLIHNEKMDFFGFTNSDLVSPLGILIRGATDGLLLTPDWSRNLDICDIINHETPESAQLAARVLTRRLQETDQNIVYLSLILVDTCIKNCGLKFATTVERAFMEEVIAAAKGSKGKKNEDEALRFIQEWGRDFEAHRNTLPIFHDTYVALKSRGLRFPQENSSRIVNASSTISTSYDFRLFLDFSYSLNVGTALSLSIIMIRICLSSSPRMKTSSRN